MARAPGASEHGPAHCHQLCGRSGLGEASRPELKAVTEARRLQSRAGWRSHGSSEGSPLTYFRVPQSCQEVRGGTESKHSRGPQSETARDLLWPGAVTGGTLLQLPEDLSGSPKLACQCLRTRLCTSHTSADARKSGPSTPLLP